MVNPATNAVISFEYSANDMMTNTWGRSEFNIKFNPCYEQKDIECNYNLIRQHIEEFRASHTPLEMHCKFKIEGKFNRSDIRFETTEFSIFHELLKSHGMITPSVPPGLTQ